MKLTLWNFKITGVFPLLTHNPASMKAGQIGAKQKKIPTPEDEARAGIYFDGDGNCCLRADSFRSAILNGVKGLKIGRSSAASVLQSAIFPPTTDLTPILHPDSGEPFREGEYEIDSRRAVVQRQGIVRSRPKFTRWACVASLLIDEEAVKPEAVEEFLNIAGQKAGVGDYRIERRGPFGGFTASLIR